jgi:DNA-binding MarR family transcriptional regulator
MQSNQRFNLTERQRSIMDYIVQINQETGTTPTQRQISQEFKIAQATVAKHLASMERRGWVQRARGFKNGMTIV